MHDGERDRDLAAPGGLPGLRLGRGDRQRCGVGGHRQRQFVKRANDPWQTVVVGIEAERGHPRCANDVCITDLCLADDPHGAGPGSCPLGSGEHELEPGGLGRARRCGGHTRRQPLGFDRDVASESIGAERHHVERQRSAAVDRRWDEVCLGGINPILLRQENEEAKVGSRLSGHQHPGILGGGA